VPQDRIHVKRSSHHRILNSFFFGAPIYVQSFQSWAMRIERIPVFFNFDGDTNFQHFSQFHVAPASVIGWRRPYGWLELISSVTCDRRTSQAKPLIFPQRGTEYGKAVQIRSLFLLESRRPDTAHRGLTSDPTNQLRLRCPKRDRRFRPLVRCKQTYFWSRGCAKHLTHYRKLVHIDPGPRFP